MTTVLSYETVLPYTPTENLICLVFTGVALLQVCAALPVFASAGEQKPCSCRDHVLHVLYWYVLLVGAHWVCFQVKSKESNSVCLKQNIFTDLLLGVESYLLFILWTNFCNKEECFIQHFLYEVTFFFLFSCNCIFPLSKEKKKTLNK